MNPNWAFAKKPFWIFSHFFVLASAGLFVFLGLWQFDRLDERRAFNTQITDAQSAEMVEIDGIELEDGFGEFRSVEIRAKTIDPDFIRVVNRTQNGIAGEHVVALVELDGTQVFLNRGFVPSRTQVGGLPDEFFATGRIRTSVTKGFFDVEDVGNSEIAPRLNVDALAARLESSSNSQIPQVLADGLDIETNTIAPVWIQLSTIENSTPALPTVLGLPEITEGSHFSYALQWLIFAGLTPLFYVLILRRRSSKTRRPDGA